MTNKNSNKNKPRKTYTDEQKANAVKRVNDGETMTAVAADLKCSLQSVSKWLSKAAEIHTNDEPKDLSAEVTKLKAQIKALTDERNALAYMAYASKAVMP